MAGTTQGALKARAARLGIALAALLAAHAAGQLYCTACRALHPRAAFGRDSSRQSGFAASCAGSRNRRARASYTPKPKVQRPSRQLVPTRPGDRLQARSRVNVLVQWGRIPHPNTLPCVDCDDDHATSGRRHEYDHHLGYDADHQLDVEAVCTVCHNCRTRDRGELRQVRGPRGRYVGKGAA